MYIAYLPYYLFKLFTLLLAYPLYLITSITCLRYYVFICLVTHLHY